MTDAPEEFDLLFTAAEAAPMLGVTPAAVRQWARRGHLVAIDHDDRGRPRYRGIDLLRAEAATRKHARRA